MARRTVQFVLTLMLVLVSVCLYVYIVWSFPARYASKIGDVRFNLPAGVDITIKI